MADRVLPGSLTDGASCKEAVCIHTNKIYDSCRDKDCIEELRLYPTASSQSYIENAVSVRARSAKLLYAAVDVEEVAFNRGYYTVDVRYFYKITGDAFSLSAPPAVIEGLAIFDKRVILFGSEGRAKVFTSDTALNALDGKTVRRSNMPKAVVEAVDPIILNMKVVDVCDNSSCDCCCDVPRFISESFGCDISLDASCKRVYITLGQFSIIRLERDSQLVIPVFDYCMPEKECTGCGDDDPCALFSRISFPVDEFFPPDAIDNCECYRDALNNN